MKIKKIVFLITVSIGLIIYSINIFATVRNGQAETVLEQFKTNNSGYKAAQKRGEMYHNDLYDIEVIDYENTISSNNLFLQNFEEEYNIQMESGEMIDAGKLAEQIDNYILDNILNKQKAAYSQMQGSISKAKSLYPNAEQGHTGERLLFQQYCDLLYLPVNDAEVAYYSALETEYRAELNIVTAKQIEGYSRKIDVSSTNAKLESLLAKKNIAINDYTSAKLKIEKNTGVAISNIEEYQIPDHSIYTRDKIKEEFRTVGTYIAYQDCLCGIYQNYIGTIREISNQMSENMLSTLTSEVEPTPSDLIFELKLKQYMSNEISNYEIEIQICELNKAQYETDISLYTDQLYYAVNEYMALYQAIQTEIDADRKQRCVQEALYTEGMGTHYEVLQWDTKIKEKELELRKAQYQLMRVVYIIDHHIENQEI